MLKEAITKYISGVILLGLLLFIPAGSLRWSNGWLLMAILFVPMFFAGLVMLAKSPELLRTVLRIHHRCGHSFMIFRIIITSFRGFVNHLRRFVIKVCEPPLEYLSFDIFLSEL